ncbi:TerD family protein [Streptomyces sp. NPDC021096]|uniref:TerD family protein n=1 Tax=Streptomyces sp. NPDC021096 TaxID=3154792 RepID=UPI003403997A
MRWPWHHGWPVSRGKGSPVSSLNKGIAKVEVALKWDPSPAGAPAHDLDIIAATYVAGAADGTPAYLVHFDSRSPDGTITLNRDSRTGQGLGYDEVMTLELDRLAPAYVRVVIGVAVQQGGGRLAFGDIANTGVRITEGYDELARDDFSGVAGATAATVAEFVRDASGAWTFHGGVRGFDTDPVTFAAVMGRTSAS